jgi:hypothetical protein
MLVLDLNKVLMKAEEAFDGAVKVMFHVVSQLYPVSALFSQVRPSEFRTKCAGLHLAVGEICV